MKRLFLVVFSIFFFAGVLTTTGFSTPYDQVYLKQVGVSPSASGSFHFPVLGNVTVYYGLYNLMIDWDMGSYNYEPINGFCIENAWSPKNKDGIVYEIIPVADWGGVYLNAAWVFSEFLKGHVSAQAAQIAIWELVLDPGNLNPKNSNGNFYARFSNGYVDEAYTLLQGGIGSVNSGFAIANNPVGSTSRSDYQNYLIQVPEPGTILLLGAGLLGVGYLARRKRFTR